MAKRENIGLVLAFEIFPPTQIDTPSFSGSMICIAGQTAVQFPHIIHFSGLISTLFNLGFGRIAPVGQDAITLGISQIFAANSWLMRGIIR